MKTTPKYPNFLSQLIFKPLFKYQWVVPERPSFLAEGFLCWYEKYFLSIDLDSIKVEKPVFVVSLPRTGSTMLQHILSTHPDLAYTTHMIHVFRTCFCGAEKLRKKMNVNVEGERFLKDSIVVQADSPSDPVAFWADWLNEDPYSTKFTEHKIEDFTLGAIKNIHEVVRRIIWCFDGASRFICKNPGLVSHVALLKDVFPDAKFIHLVRDPRMNANSMVKLYRLCKEQLELIRNDTGKNLGEGRDFVPYPRMANLEKYLEEFGADDVRTTARLWNDSLDFIKANKEKMGDVIDVRYEDILAEPKKEIARVLDFCELPNIVESNEEFKAEVSKVGKTHHENPDYGNFDVIESICREKMSEWRYL